MQMKARVLNNTSDMYRGVLDEMLEEGEIDLDGYFDCRCQMDNDIGGNKASNAGRVLEEREPSEAGHRILG